MSVIVLDSGSGGPGSSTGWCTVVCSWERHVTVMHPLFINFYRWIQAKLKELRHRSCVLKKIG